MLKLMMLTDNPEIALLCQSAGVDRIFFDLEYVNKRERQAGRNTVLSAYNIDVMPGIRRVLNKSDLLVRVNPIYFGSKAEINKSIEYGADMIMLPMALDAADVSRFVSICNGRARTCVMIETPQAFSRINDILEIDGIDEIFIGLNDLHIGLGLTFMFEILSGGIIDFIADKCHKKKIPFGFGGIAKIGEGILPAENIIGEHYRLGSSGVILSRTFKNCFTSDGKPDINFDFAEEVAKIRAQENICSLWGADDFEANRKMVVEKVRTIVEKMQ